MREMDDGAGFGPEERRQLEALNRALERWAAEAGERLRRPATEEVPGPTPELPGAGRSAPKPKVAPGAGWGWGLLAAAAAAGVLLVARGPAVPEAPVAPAGVTLSADGLDVASDRSFMVVPTRNPDIAVVWMLDSGD